ncbi:amino acid permease [Desulforamulus aquiferis]|uniref:Amino acid permease n=1 Tax=Desulforamulus aquiferis TaxID=1397668 RepID=A0AAW7ZFT3_9FIRM|nr:amino acid permease [Desulforamulus aquiferis]MDO7788567.1 amino acid permease [Desulforamulus aquiferis]
MQVKEAVLLSRDMVAGQELQRGLKARHLQLIALGGIIGSGYFLGTGYVIDSVGPAASLAYLLGGLIVLCVMLCLGELAVAVPISSSFVTYANDFISPSWACGVGWSYWLTWVTYVPAEMIAAGIIMNFFFPSVGTLWWAVFFGLIITIINLSYVGTFGEMEFWLAIIKIMAIIMFVIMAGLIFLGVIGKEGFMGSSVLLGEGGFIPKGSWAIFLTMVIILVNFQGSEIIGLAAGESKEPEKTIPVAIRNVTWRIVALYVIPVFLLVCIYPWNKAGLEESVFAAALNHHGFQWAGGLFSFVVLTAAISCSNSGLYGCTRAVYALAREGMAPAWLGKLNKNSVPQNATILSVLGCWVGVIAYTFDTSEVIFTYLLALSGFTGAIAWISICWSQLNFRRRLEKSGYDINKLKYRTPLFPYLTHFAIWIQVACLAVIALNEELRASFYIGVPLLMIPIIWYKVWGHKLKPMDVKRVKYEDLFKV